VLIGCVVGAGTCRVDLPNRVCIGIDVSRILRLRRAAGSETFRNCTHSETIWNQGETLNDIVVFEHLT